MRFRVSLHVIHALIILTLISFCLNSCLPDWPHFLSALSSCVSTLWLMEDDLRGHGSDGPLTLCGDIISLSAECWSVGEGNQHSGVFFQGPSLNKQHDWRVRTTPGSRLCTKQYFLTHSQTGLTILNYKSWLIGPLIWHNILPKISFGTILSHRQLGKSLMD